MQSNILENRNTLRYRFLLMLFVAALPCFSQRVSWQKPEPVKPELQLFHSTQLVNLPTAETRQQSDLIFTVSHRFIPPVTRAKNGFYGLDGPVNIRLGLSYALTDKILITLARSNEMDNLDLQTKYKALAIRHSSFPVLISLNAGAAWNRQVFGKESGDPDNFQYYGQMIINTLYNKKLGLGVVPSYVYNSHIECIDKQYSFTLGNYVQYYISSLWSLYAEWNPTVTGFRDRHNSVPFGFELDTGGHFFKIILTNNARVNPSHFLSGADIDFNSRDWRLGFTITRLFSL